MNSMYIIYVYFQFQAYYQIAYKLFQHLLQWIMKEKETKTLIKKLVIVKEIFYDKN